MRAQASRSLATTADPIRLFCVGSGLLILAGLLSGCQTPQQAVTQKEDNLAAAGFLVRPANTPERQAMLSKLPANHFVQRVRGNDVHYVYADPLVCNCLYVGSQQAYGAYKLHQQQQNIASEQQLTASEYSDAGWNWGAWEPEGGFGGGFGPEFGPGLGW